MANERFTKFIIITASAISGMAQMATKATFEIIRMQTSCKGVLLISSEEDPSVLADENQNCSVFDWLEIQKMEAYTTFDQGGLALEARIGPLFVLNSDPRLDYECPPDQYNGFDYRFSFCQIVDNSTMMAVAYVSDGMMYGLDAILSGKPFPADLEVNQPPFGAARFKFSSPIPMQSVGSLTVCSSGDHQSVSCAGANEDEALDLQGIVYSGFGSFSLQGIEYSGPSVWIHDDDRQLLHITAGQAQGFWFNNSGFFLADYQMQTCTWFSNCNFACEVYNYDSRFLDFIGIWNITGKYGAMDDFVPTLVRVYLGNAIDAAGVFPCLMYISVETNYYLGLDKLDTTVGTGGSSFWYSRTVGGTPDFSNYPLPSDLNCPGTLEEWLTNPINSSASNFTQSPVGDAVGPTSPVPSSNARRLLNTWFLSLIMFFAVFSVTANVAASLIT